MKKILTNRLIVAPAACGVLPLALMPLSQYLALAPWGSFLFLTIEMIFVMGCMAGVLAFVIGIVFACRPTTRSQGALILMCCVIYCPATVQGFCFGQAIRRQAFHEFVQNSQPVVTAIKQYEKKYGCPPSALEDVTPEFLSEFPGTGIGAYPDYRYELPSKPGQYEGNDWALIVETGYGLNFDIIMYLPKQNYPERGYGGTLERIDDWAYVHE
jgi:hypothetical protein